MTEVNSLPWPTPHLAQLFPGLRARLGALEALICGDAGYLQSSSPHADSLRALRRLLHAGEPLLAVFLAYPTRRGSGALLKVSFEAQTLVATLAQTPPPQLSGESLQAYEAHCNRLQAAISDWRLAVDLKQAEFDLEHLERETLH